MRGSFRSRPWGVIIFALAGLLASVGAAGLVALIITANVGQVAGALRSDVELEDRADDLRVAVLDVRHFHRNLVFTGPTASGSSEFELAFERLTEGIAGLEDIDIIVPGIARPDEIRRQAERYYADFRPAIAEYSSDPSAFEAASELGLARLAAIEAEAQELDKLGEQLAAAALRNVNEATSTATVILVLVLAGIGAAGAALAYAAFRVLGELRSLYAAQQDATARMEIAVRTKTDFLADASHELRTPLTVLRGNAELGLEAGAEDCGHDRILREIVDESTRMTRLVEDLLFLARSDAGSVPLDRRPVDLEPWLAEVGARAEMLARGRGITLAPSLTATGEADLDGHRIEQVVMILVDNAAKHSRAGTAVSVDARRRGGRLVIEVSDRGSGIPETELAMIFERFYRVDKVRARREGGAGLGLAIARAIVQAHGGTIDATSRLGQGTRMTVTLPLSEPADIRDAPAMGRSSTALRWDEGSAGGRPRSGEGIS